MTNKKQTDIFNYDFNWQQDEKEVCCEKFKKKGEKRCKKCPDKKIK